MTTSAASAATVVVFASFLTSVLNSGTFVHLTAPELFMRGDWLLLI